jgi:predicted choloylglycine hydrolase
MLSEKTFKAFAWHQIPIFNATKGHVDKVRSLGFDLFDDIINHNYDAAPNNYMQKLKILNEISKFLKNYNSINDINNLRKGIFHRLQANNDLLYKLYKYKQRPQEPWPYFG